MSNIEAGKIVTAAVALNSVTRNQQLTKLWEKALLDNATSFQERSKLTKTEAPVKESDLSKPGKLQSAIPNFVGNFTKSVILAGEKTSSHAKNIVSSGSSIGKGTVPRGNSSASLIQAPQNNTTLTVDRFKSSIHKSNFLSQATANSNALATTPPNYLVVTHEKEVKIWYRSKDSSSGLDLLKQLRASFSSFGLQLVSMTVNGENIYSKNNDPQRLNENADQKDTAEYKFNQEM